MGRPDPSRVNAWVNTLLDLGTSKSLGRSPPSLKVRPQPPAQAVVGPPEPYSLTHPHEVGIVVVCGGA
jgi:hypothetical protein